METVVSLIPRLPRKLVWLIPIRSLRLFGLPILTRGTKLNMSHTSVGLVGSVYLRHWMIILLSCNYIDCRMHRSYIAVSRPSLWALIIHVTKSPLTSQYVMNLVRKEKSLRDTAPGGAKAQFSFSNFWILSVVGRPAIGSINALPTSVFNSWVYSRHWIPITRDP